MTYGTTLERAQRLASRAEAALIEAEDNFRDGREIVRYEVRGHAWAEGWNPPPTAWGVWPVWRYADRPDLPEFGGPFVPIADLEALDD